MIVRSAFPDDRGSENGKYHACGDDAPSGRDAPDSDIGRERLP